MSWRDDYFGLTCTARARDRKHIDYIVEGTGTTARDGGSADYVKKLLSAAQYISGQVRTRQTTVPGLTGFSQKIRNLLHTQA